MHCAKSWRKPISAFALLRDIYSHWAKTCKVDLVRGGPMPWWLNFLFTIDPPFLLRACILLYEETRCSRNTDLAQYFRELYSIFIHIFSDDPLVTGERCLS